MSRMKLVSWKARPSCRAGSRAAPAAPGAAPVSRAPTAPDPAPVSPSPAAPRPTHSHAPAARRPSGWRGAVQGADDLGGVRGEAVGGVGVAALAGGKQPGREVVGTPVPPVQSPAQLVRRGGGHPASRFDSAIDATCSLRYAL